MVFGGARFLQEAIPDLPERSKWFTAVSILSINGLLHLFTRNYVCDVTSIRMNADVCVSCRATYGFMEEAERSGNTEKETLLNKLLKVGNCLLDPHIILYLR